MKVSFDGLRRNIALCWNEYIESLSSEWESDRLEALDNLRFNISNLMCVYDDNIADDCNDLSDIKILSQDMERMDNENK